MSAKNLQQVVREAQKSAESARIQIAIMKTLFRGRQRRKMQSEHVVQQAGSRSPSSPFVVKCGRSKMHVVASLADDVLQVHEKKTNFGWKYRLAECFSSSSRTSPVKGREETVDVSSSC